jgi:aspartate racemase
LPTLGIIGGIGPESTAEYYRLLIAEYRRRNPDGSAPSIIINSIDVKRLLDMVAAGELHELANWLTAEIERLASAGAGFALLASNTPHIVFNELRTSIPLISIVEATRDYARARNLRRLGLFGTRFTMGGSFYPEVLAPIEIVRPNDGEQQFIHDKYINELLKGMKNPETRDRLLRIVDRLKDDEAIDGLILGGTELPLILSGESHNGVPILDTTRIHVERAVERLLAEP